MRWAQFKANWRRKRYPAAVWLTVFSVLNILFIFAISYIEENTAHQLTRDSIQHVINQNEKELHNALVITEQALKRNTQALAEWEELKAQFIDPSYYFFWVQQSLPSSRFWIPSARELVLYDPDGKLIRQFGKTKLQYLPETMPFPPTPMAYTDKTNQQTLTLIFQPVLNEQQNLLGYVGVAYDLKTALALSQALPHLALSQIQVTRTGRFPAEGLAHVLSIAPQQHPAIKTLLEHIHLHKWVFIFVAVILVGINFYAFYHLFFRPLAHFTRQAKRLHASTPIEQQDDHQSPAIAELGHLQRLLILLHNHWARALSKVEKEREKYQKLALIDPVTGLGNRLALKTQCKLEQGSPRALVLADIAYFRAINDSFGPQQGDETLKFIADFLKDALGAEKNHVFRIGSDEFVILVFNHSLITLTTLLNTLNDHLKESLKTKTKESFGFPLKLRFGIAPWEDKTCDLSTCLKRADIALQYAKTHHLSFQVYNDDIVEHTLNLDHAMVQHITHAVKTGEALELYFQPIVALDSGKILYQEILMRITSQQSLLPPYQIFQIIDRHHLHQKLDQTIINKTAELLKTNTLPDGQGISLNLCAQTLLSEDLTALLAPLAPHCKERTIIIEVLETALMKQLEIVRDKLVSLRKLGFKVALDDFGSGYSSLSYLAELPVDTIKVDRSLTLKLLNQNSNTQFIGEIIKLLNVAGFCTVIEGIETPEQCKKVQELGASAVQGYLFARPRPVPLAQLETSDPCTPSPTPSH